MIYFDPILELCFTRQMANNVNSMGKRTKEESLRTKQKILDEAERLFAKLGYGGVSIREIAKASDIHHRTIHYHFKSKQGVYDAVVNRWDNEVEQRLIKAIGNETDINKLIEAVIDELFDFLLLKKDWVALTARAAMDEEVDNPDELVLQQNGWINFVNSIVETNKIENINYDMGLLMITIEGMLYHHILAQKHYRALFGKPVTDPQLKQKTKKHLKKVVIAALASLEE